MTPLWIGMAMIWLFVVIYSIHNLSVRVERLEKRLADAPQEPQEGKK